MTKNDFIEKLAAIYRTGNRSDNEAKHEHDEAWTHHEMAYCVCARIDHMLHDMKKAGVISDDELAEFYSTL